MARQTEHTAKDKARFLFFAYYDKEDIVRRTGTARAVVDRWCTEWSWERKSMTTDLITSVKDQNHASIARLFQVGVPLIHNSLVARAKEGKPLTLHESKAVTDILMSFDKMQRLESIQPTDIQTVRAVTIDDLKKAVLEDDFLDIIPMKEITDGTVDGREIDRGDESTGDEEDSGVSDESASEQGERPMQVNCTEQSESNNSQQTGS